MARIICFIIIPVAFYLGLFKIHFSILTENGPGAVYMTVETQSELNDLPLVDTPVRT